MRLAVVGGSDGTRGGGASWWRLMLVSWRDLVAPVGGQSIVCGEAVRCQPMRRHLTEMWEEVVEG